MNNRRGLGEGLFGTIEYGPPMLYVAMGSDFNPVLAGNLGYLSVLFNLGMTMQALNLGISSSSGYVVGQRPCLNV